MNEIAKDNEKVNKEHDKGYRSVFSKKENFLHFLRKYIKAEWVDAVDETDLTLMDATFILKDYKNKESDVIYRLKVDGKEIIFYALLELQSSVDYTMAFRLLLYITELLRREFSNADKNERERSDYRLPAVVPMVLYNGAEQWTAVRRFKEYLAGYEMFGDNVINFEYLLLDLNRSDEAFILNTNHILDNIFALDQKSAPEDIARIMRVLIDRYRRMEASERAEFEDWLTKIFIKRVRNETSRTVILEALREGDKQKMNYGIDRAMASERLKGKREGKLEGERIGEQKGEKKRALETARKMLLKNKPINEIIEFTDLTETEIMAIKAKMQK